MAGQHAFDPAQEQREGEIFIRARCLCGWSGDAYPEHDQGYSDALRDFDGHATEAAGLGTSPT